MDPLIEIYSELRKTKQELIEKLQNDKCSLLVKPYIQGELQDVEVAIGKIEKGTFGTCEISGESMPWELLVQMPTLKSKQDCKMISYFSNGNKKY